MSLKVKDAVFVKKEGSRISDLHEGCSYPCNNISSHFSTFDIVISFGESCPEPLDPNKELYQISYESPCHQNVNIDL